MDKISAASSRSVQHRPTRRDGWTKQKRTAFLDHLAATANVAHALRQVGMQAWAAYRLRRRDPAFAAQWHEALQTAYVRLESEVLALALRSAGAEDEGGERPSEVAAFSSPIDPEDALKVLIRRGAVGHPQSNKPPGPGYKKIDRDQLTKALERQLAALEKRLRGQ